MKSIRKYLNELTTLSDENKIKVKMRCACGVIVKEAEDGEDLILVLKRSPDDHWPHAMDLPRGKCDGGENKNYNEKLMPCLKREVKEETGLDIIPIGFIDKFSYLADRGTRQTTQYNFLCEIKDPKQKVKLSREHIEYEWVSSMGQIELMLMPEMKKTVSKVFNKDLQVINYGDSGEQNKIEEYDKPGDLDEMVTLYLEKIQ